MVKKTLRDAFLLNNELTTVNNVQKFVTGITFKRIYHLVQRQQTLILVKLLDATSKDTFIKSNNSTMTRKKEASRNLPAGVGSLPLLTLQNRGLRLSLEVFTCLCRQI